MVYIKVCILSSIIYLLLYKSKLVKYLVLATHPKLGAVFQQQGCEIPSEKVKSSPLCVDNRWQFHFSIVILEGNCEREFCEFFLQVFDFCLKLCVAKGRAKLCDKSSCGVVEFDVHKMFYILRNRKRKKRKNVLEQYNYSNNLCHSN